MGSYLTIQEWMLDLGLRGNELLAFAVVYSFSRDGQSRYVGGATYLSRWLGISKKSARNILNKLAEFGIIGKTDRIVDGVRYCDYAYNPEGVGKKLPRGREESSLGVGKKLPRGREESSHSNNNSNDISKDISYSVCNNAHSAHAHTREGFDFLSSLIAGGVDSNAASQWLQVRKVKRLVNTEIAFNDFVSEAEKAGLSLDDAVRYAVAHSWGGFRASWYHRDRNDDATMRQNATPDGGDVTKEEWYIRAKQIEAEHLEEAQRKLREEGLL